MSKCKIDASEEPETRHGVPSRARSCTRKLSPRDYKGLRFSMMRVAALATSQFIASKADMLVTLSVMLLVRESFNSSDSKRANLIARCTSQSVIFNALTHISPETYNIFKLTQTYQYATIVDMMRRSVLKTRPILAFQAYLWSQNFLHNSDLVAMRSLILIVDFLLIFNFVVACQIEQILARYSVLIIGWWQEHVVALCHQ